MGHFEDRVRQKLQNAEFAAGYEEALREVASAVFTADPGVELTVSQALPAECDIEVSWASPVCTSVYV